MKVVSFYKVEFQIINLGTDCLFLLSMFADGFYQPSKVPDIQISCELQSSAGNLKATKKPNSRLGENDRVTRKIGRSLTAVKREKFAKVKQSTLKLRLSFSLF